MSCDDGLNSFYVRYYVGYRCRMGHEFWNSNIDPMVS